MMTIASVVQRGGSVHVYNEKGQVLSVLLAGAGKNDGLVGYTGSSVSIRKGGSIYTYNEKGQILTVTLA